MQTVRISCKNMYKLGSLLFAVLLNMKRNLFSTLAQRKKVKTRQEAHTVTVTRGDSHELEAHSNNRNSKRKDENIFSFLYIKINLLV